MFFSALKMRGRGVEVSKTLFYYKESNHGPIRHQHNLRTPTLRKGSKEPNSALWSTGVIASLQLKL